MVWFTLPGRYTICAKDVMYSIAGFHFSTVTDQFHRCSSVNDLICKYARKEAGDFIPCISDNNEQTSTKNWAYYSPPSIAGVSDWIVSVAMGLSHCGTFIAGFGALKHFHSTVFRGSLANWVITLNIFLF
jgi:hypothetical protein